LNPGQSATFTFVSTEAPSGITTSPQGESVAYLSGIDFSQNVYCDSTPAFSPTYSPVPESSSPGLLAVGCFGAIVMMRKRVLKTAAAAVEAE